MYAQCKNSGMGESSALHKLHTLTHTHTHTHTEKIFYNIKSIAKKILIIRLLIKHTSGVRLSHILSEAQRL